MLIIRFNHFKDIKMLELVPFRKIWDQLHSDFMSFLTRSNGNKFEKNLRIVMIRECHFIACVKCEILTGLLNLFTFAKPLEISKNEFCCLLKKHIVIPFPGLIYIISTSI